MNVGFIGLGIMGSRMAANLISGGYSLTVTNRSLEKATPLRAKGAHVAASPAEVAGNADVIITMLSRPEAVTSVVGGDEGILAHMRPGTLWIDCSTVDPTFTGQMAAAAQQQGIRFLDAPVAGSKNQAAEGVLVFFVGGDEADVAEARPLFEVMGSRVVHLGANGRGTSLKLVINHLLGTSMAAFAEALRLGAAMGFSRDTLLNALVGGAVTPPYMATKREKLAQDQYDPEFPLRLMAKDMALVGQMADGLDLQMPVSRATHQQFQAATDADFGDYDFSALVKFVG